MSSYIGITFLLVSVKKVENFQDIFPISQFLSVSNFQEIFPISEVNKTEAFFFHISYKVNLIVPVLCISLPDLFEYFFQVNLGLANNFG